METYDSSFILNYVNPPQPYVELDDDLEISWRSFWTLAQQIIIYLVDWLGYTPNDWTWEHAKDMANVAVLIAEFHH